MQQLGRHLMGFFERSHPGARPPVSSHGIGLRVKSILTLVLAVSGTSLLFSQTTFEVMSVKPNISGDPPTDPGFSPGRFSWANVTLRQLIQVAHDVRPFQLFALPEWADTARFDVMATAGFPASPQQMKGMLQALLADRFNLAAHHDKREVPV